MIATKNIRKKSTGLGVFLLFWRNRKAAVAVEMAFILPILTVLTFLTWDAGTIFTQYKRGTRHYYAFADALASQTGPVTCKMLDSLSEVVYESYRQGNWARRPRDNGSDFNRDGALDFRYTIRIIEAAKDPASANAIRGKVDWVYYRHTEDMDSTNGGKPGEFIDIPTGLQIEGISFVQVDGDLFIAPAVNYLGVFDFNKADDTVVHKNIDIKRYFPLRFQTSIPLNYTVQDPLTEKCSDGSNYP